jgi:hypothetical protein
MDTALILKVAAIAFALLGGGWSLLAARVPRVDGPDPDRRRRRHYLFAYGATSVSVLLLAGMALA